jgi:transcriptional regulator with GAF, ATPase, and Fis domain
MIEAQIIDLLRKAFSLQGAPGEREDTGSRHPLDLSEEELASLASIIESIKYGPSQVIFREGEMGDALYVIQSGRLLVLKESEQTGEQHLLLELEAPSIFGEMALLDNSPRSATVQVSPEGSAHLLRISMQNFQRFLKTNPQAALKVTYCLAQLLSHRLRASNVERLRLEREKLKEEVQRLRQQIHQRYRFEEIIGVSPAMRRVFDLMEKVLPSSITVLIQGETGTGKELIARALHYNGPRRQKPFMAVNCATLHKELLESELFGHEKGAFTGADHRRIGRLELANGGTLFLDEIGDMHPSIQAKLLRVLQERCFERLGGNQTIYVDVRLIAATNRDLLDPSLEIPFRKDLYYRIGVMTIQVPPLRERPEDIPLLAQHFLERYRPKESPLQGFHRDTLRLLQRHPWPGNVRELENVIHRATLIAEGPLIMPQDLLLEEPPPPKEAVHALGDLNLERLEQEAIKEALLRAQGIQTEAAKLLGITRRVLNYKLKKHGITPDVIF